MAGGAKAHRLRRALCVFLTLLALVLVGTVIVLSTVVRYFGVDRRDIITEPEMLAAEQWAAAVSNAAAAATVSEHGATLPGEATAKAGTDVRLPSWSKPEDGLPLLPDTHLEAGSGGAAADARAPALHRRFSEPSAAPTLRPGIPKIIHQTWKTNDVPDRWKSVRQTCIDLHPDYEYMLWSDESSSEFIAKEYPWFLATFDSYTYPIQRADAIRYFVLHHYGGVYMDLDIGCRRNMDPLLYFQVILPATIPVGVSNDLMFSEKEHPFMDLVIHNLVTFDHQYGTNYPTVMFSTGPMFLSAQYGLWPKEDVEGEERQVRILPRRWYGKNAPEVEMQGSFFDHYYGSSWHADDAGFITFLGKFGMVLMYLGFSIVVLGVARLLWSKRSFLRAKSHRALGPIALPSGATANLPYARPGSPSDTDDGSKSAMGTPGRGVLYYLPVWFFPPESGARTPMPTSSGQGGSWSQYFSNVSYIDDGSGRPQYQPIPSFSRPGSPSNNSVLHAPGTVHDGAFDGMQLRSIHGQQPYPYADTRPAPTPLSPNAPPAYSSLKGWGSQFFRSPRTALMALAASRTSDDDYDRDDVERRGSVDDVFHEHTLKSASQPVMGFALGRPRSPLPQYQRQSSTRSASPTTQVGRDDSRSADGDSATAGTAKRLVEQSSGAGTAVRPVSMARSRSAESQGADRFDASERVATGRASPIVSSRRSSTTCSDAHDRRGSQDRSVDAGSGRDGLVPGSPEGSVATTIESFDTAADTYAVDGDDERWLEGSVEEEVDRLLNEMDPTAASRTT
ncbi:hypothetical protein OIV83_000520 [Microbotryomycetes sp. JL201]|nr:hypothetical protein OIV83_000520 [Microbotryomycetes sp. JL201]